MKNKLLKVLGISTLCLIMMFSGGCGKTVSVEEYDALKTQYDELAGYTDELEKRINYLEAKNMVYQEKLEGYIAAEEAGNRVEVLEPLMPEEE